MKGKDRKNILKKFYDKKIFKKCPYLIDIELDLFIIATNLRMDEVYNMTGFFRTYVEKSKDIYTFADGISLGAVLTDITTSCMTLGELLRNIEPPIDYVSRLLQFNDVIKRYPDMLKSALGEFLEYRKSLPLEELINYVRRIYTYDDLNEWDRIEVIRTTSLEKLYQE